MLISSELKVDEKEASAKCVKAEAVIRRVRELIGINGRKELVGGMISKG